MLNGIAGATYPDTYYARELTQSMLTTLNHRGKGGGEKFSYKNFELGSTHTKITWNKKKNVAAVLDGCFTNREEILKALQEKNVSPFEIDPQSLLVATYEAFGSTFLEKLSGEFTFALFDKKEDKLILAKDRIGKKPLYWYQDHNHFIFASEMKALMSTGAVPQTPSREAIASYLYFGFIPQDMSSIQSINKLLPGHYLQFHLSGRLTIHSYWSYSPYFTHTTKTSKKEQVATLDKLLQTSVKARLSNSEKLPGCIISGGLGSASIAYHLSKSLNQKSPLHGFTVSFQEENVEEVTKEITDNLHIQQHTTIITPELFLKQLVPIIWHLDEPIADPRCVAIWNLGKLARTYTDNIFSGIGSDELLEGLSRYTKEETKASSLNFLFSPFYFFAQKVILPLFKTLKMNYAYTLVKELHKAPWQFDYLKHSALFSQSLLNKASPKLSKQFDLTAFLNKFYGLSKIKSQVASYLYFNVKTRLPDSFILQFERLLSCHELSWQTPYLDRNIVEYLATLPETSFLNKKGTDSLLKPLLKGVFSDTFIQRPMNMPKQFLQSWLQNPAFKHALQLLPKGVLVDSEIISKEWLMKELKTLESKPDLFLHFFSILSLEIWFRLYINGPIRSSAPEVSTIEFLK